MVKVKICGITNYDDALAAAEFGADALGFVFYKKSPRYISPEKAGEIISRIPPFVATVGVFVDEEKKRIERIMEQAGLDAAQFHGNEPPEACIIPKRTIKAIRVKELTDLEPMKEYKVGAFLLDTYTPEAPGGTGQIFNWSIALDAKVTGVRIILAGGLTPDNVAQAILMVKPYGVDVSSGVELEKGIKDHEKMRLFIHRAKEAIPFPGLVP
ncbi:MAG: phosphoribosylanthranilate isomerase [Nitrospiraceae bacterium]|nr:phosphoribosylanthranilate isomerase [Nitrospiraceae bacterium]